VAQRSILLLFLGDPRNDRRVQNLQRLFAEAGWKVELIGPQTFSTAGPRKFYEYDRALKQAVKGKIATAVMACDLYSLSVAVSIKRSGRAEILFYDAREVYTELPTVARKPLAKAIWKRVERRGLRHTDIVVATGPQDVQAILSVHRFLPRTVLVRNLPWRDETLMRDDAIRQRYGIPKEARTLVYIGGLQIGRGLESLINAIPLIRDDCKLLVIGIGALKSNLEKVVTDLQLQNRVFFIGALPSEEAMRVIASCDVGISLIEPISRSYELALPSKLFEYMMAGLIVVSSPLDQVVELFPNEPWLVFANPSDIGSIAKSVDEAIAKVANATLRQKERELALSQYHFERDAVELLEVLEQQLA
jgi:glycogen(starch) synthase